MEVDFLTSNLSFENIEFENLLDNQIFQPNSMEIKFNFHPRDGYFISKFPIFSLPDIFFRSKPY
jgi:hypothetical protein